MRRVLRLLLLLLCLVLWSAASPRQAIARKPGKADRKLAKKLNRVALQLYADKAYAEAAEMFEKAYKLVPAPIVVYNLARALHRSGALLRAKPFYEELVLKFPKFDSVKRAKAYQYIKDIDAQLAADKIKADEKLRQAGVNRKSARWTRQGASMTAEGRHKDAAQIYLTAHSEQPSAKWLSLAARAFETAGDLAAARVQYGILANFRGADPRTKARAKRRLAAIDAQLTKPTGQPPPRTRRPTMRTALVRVDDAEYRLALEDYDSHVSGLRVGGWVCLIVGVLGAGAGIGLSVVAEQQREDVRFAVDSAAASGSPVSTSTMTQSEAAAAETDANRFGLIGAAALGVGAALLVTGVILQVVAGTTPRPIKRVNVGIAPLRSGGMLSLQTTF